MTPADPPALPAGVARLGDRSLFPHLQAKSFLAHGAISPHSDPVRAMVARAQADYAARGIGAFASWNAQRKRLKARLADLLGGVAADYGFVSSTSAGLQAVAHGIDWRPGDRVVLFTEEFPTNVLPWQLAARRHDLEVEFLPQAPFATGDLGPLEAALKRGGVRLVAVSAVAFQSGLRLPVEAMAELCHAHGAEISVDAIQAAGAVPIDLTRFDYAAGGGHKWLMGPEGASWLYVHPDRIADLRPELAGWLSLEAPADFLFGRAALDYHKPVRRETSQVEAGAPNTIGYAGLEPGVALVEQLGVAAVFDHIQRWHDAAEETLCARGFRSLRAGAGFRSGILSFAPPEGTTAAEWVERFAAAGVVITGPCDCVRLAPHWPNALDEIEVLSTAIR